LRRSDTAAIGFSTRLVRSPRFIGFSLPVMFSVHFPPSLLHGWRVLVILWQSACYVG
jgi:hypothetical protein